MLISVKPADMEILIDALEEGMCQVSNLSGSAKNEGDLLEYEMTIRTLRKYIEQDNKKLNRDVERLQKRI